MTTIRHSSIQQDAETDALNKRIAELEVELRAYRPDERDARVTELELELSKYKASLGVDLIAAERERQVSQEGWTLEHDDSHTDGSLAIAAACYALHSASSDKTGEVIKTNWFPWERKWWKPKDPLRDLVRAGALIAAEIDRLQRLGNVQMTTVEQEDSTLCNSLGIHEWSLMAGKDAAPEFRLRPGIHPTKPVCAAQCFHCNTRTWFTEEEARNAGLL